jgi:hypothetical protein
MSICKVAGHSLVSSALGALNVATAWAIGTLLRIRSGENYRWVRCRIRTADTPRAATIGINMIDIPMR